MPKDTPVTKPVLVHLNPRDWEQFKELCGSGKASRRIRAIIRRELKKANA